MRKVGRFKIGKDFECPDTPTGRTKGMGKIREGIRSLFRQPPDVESVNFQRAINEKLDYYFGLRERNKAIVELTQSQGWKDLIEEIDIRHETESRNMPGGVLRLWLDKDPHVVVSAIEHLLWQGIKSILDGAKSEYDAGGLEVEKLINSITDRKGQ